VRPAVWQRRGDRPESGLSLFLAMYLLGLVGVLLGVHMLQPALENPENTSRLPTHQPRHKTAKQPAAGSEGAIPVIFARSP
jgi:hypothetical protein